VEFFFAPHPSFLYSFPYFFIVFIPFHFLSSQFQFLMETPEEQTLDLRELVRNGNEKLVAAAIDLAVFTPTGINADYIGHIAEKCENLELALRKHTSQDIMPVAEEVRQAIVTICETGKRLWASNTVRARRYELPAVFFDAVVPGRAA